jgi:hypothetical protein
MKTYRLLKDIQNPDHDKRCSYGYKKTPTFKAGTFFEGKPVSIEENAWRSAAFLSCKDWGHVNGDLAALLIGSSTESDPTNWHELAVIDGGCHHMADDVLENLIKNGILTIDQVTSALTSCLSESN